jgi:adenosylhomocysteine nucleosidase
VHAQTIVQALLSIFPNICVNPKTLNLVSWSDTVAATIAIIAALPREIAALVRGTRPEPSLLRKGVHLYRLPDATVVAAGMGAARAAIGVQAALSSGGIRTLISAGLAGSCTPELLPGSVGEAGAVVDVRTGERFTAAAPHRSNLLLATSPSIASVHEKARLAETYGASFVDMEAATVARLALAHGLKFRAIKGVSDAYDFELTSLAQFEGKHGSFRTAAFALHTAIRPMHWRRSIELGRSSTRALVALDGALKLALEA